MIVLFKYKCGSDGMVDVGALKVPGFKTRASSNPGFRKGGD